MSKELTILVIYPEDYQDFRAYRQDFMVNYAALKIYKLHFVKFSELSDTNAKYDAIIADNRVPVNIVEQTRQKLNLSRNQVSFLNIGEKQINKTTFTGEVKQIRRRKND